MHIHWEIDSEVSLHSSLNELELVLLFFWEVAKCQSYSVFWKKKKKSISICPAIAAPLCINICTVVGMHVKLSLPNDHFNQWLTRLVSLALLPNGMKQPSVGDTHPSIMETCIHKLLQIKPNTDLSTGLLFCILPHNTI